MIPEEVAEVEPICECKDCDGPRMARGHACVRPVMVGGKRELVTCHRLEFLLHPKSKE